MYIYRKIIESITRLQRYLIDAGVEFFVQGTPNRAVAGLITISGVLFASAYRLCGGRSQRAAGGSAQGAPGC